MVELLFFSDSDGRVGYLFNKEIRHVFERALFSPGEFAYEAPTSCPPTIPFNKDERGKFIATPMGLLWNELLRAPASVVEPLLQLTAK